MKKVYFRPHKNFDGHLLQTRNASSVLDGATTPGYSSPNITVSGVAVNEHGGTLYNLKCMPWCYKRLNSRDEFGDILSWEWEGRQMRNIVEIRKLHVQLCGILMSVFRILHPEYTKE